MDNSAENLTLSMQLLSTVYRHRKSLIIFNSIIAFLTIIILIITPKEYKANALVSLENKKDVFQIPSLLQDLPFGLGGFSGENAEKYIRYCSSRRVLDSVIYKFELNNYYNSKYQEDTYKKIRGNLEVWDNTDGTISISYISTDKKLSADIVSEIYSQLKMLDLELSIEQARDFRQFIALRYQEALEKLREYEDNLKKYSEISGIIELEEQIRISIQLLAELETKRVNLEISRDLIRKNISTNSSIYQDLLNQIQIINDKIAEFKKDDSNFNIPLDSIPGQSLKFIRLLRNVKIQEKIIEFLVPQVEAAELEEKKSYSSLILVDKPVPPDRKFRPKRIVRLVVTMFISIVLSIFFFRIKEIYSYNKIKVKEIVTKY